MQQNVIRLLEVQKKSTGSNFALGAVLMDLSDSLDYISCDSTVPKLATYSTIDILNLEYLHILSQCPSWIHLREFPSENLACETTPRLTL